MIKNKNRGGFIDRQRQRVGMGEEENRRFEMGEGLNKPLLFSIFLSRAREKRTTTKINQRLCTGYLQPAFQSLQSFYVS